MLFMKQVLPMLGKRWGASKAGGAAAAGRGPPQPEVPRGSGHGVLEVKRRRFTSGSTSAVAAKSNTEKFTEGAALVSISLLPNNMKHGCNASGVLS